MLDCTCIPIMVFYDFLFNCMAVGQASDSMKKLTLNFHRGVGVFGLAHPGSTVCSKVMVLLLLPHW